MPEAAYSGHAVHGWRRGMFRRRTDFSWPLILVLAVLFFLSLRLPRQWEEIARPSALVLKPHKLPQGKELPSVTGSRSEVAPLDVFRSIKPAGLVASDADTIERFTPSASYETRSAIIVPAVAQKIAPARSRPGRGTCRRANQGCDCCRRTKRQPDQRRGRCRAKHRASTGLSASSCDQGRCIHITAEERRSAGVARRPNTCDGSQSYSR